MNDIRWRRDDTTQATLLCVMNLTAATGGVWGRDQLVEVDVGLYGDTMRVSVAMLTVLALCGG